MIPSSSFPTSSSSFVTGAGQPPTELNLPGTAKNPNVDTHKTFGLDHPESYGAEAKPLSSYSIQCSDDKQGQPGYSPSNIMRYMESPFACWMDRLTMEQPDNPPEKDADDPLMQALASRGFAHESAVLEGFQSRGLAVVTIDAEGHLAKRDMTLKALQDGIDVIAQARLEMAPFAGYADFLVKVPGKSLLGDYHYEVWDAKLSSKVKPTYLVQLCCYVEMLEAIQGCRAQTITVALGDGTLERLRTSDCFYYYQSIKEGFLMEQDAFSPGQPPDPADSKTWLNWSEVAKAQLLERDHLFQVANISLGQIKKLACAGITTMQDLADTPLIHVAGINPRVLERLKAQAAIQKASVGQDRPLYEILPHGGDEPKGLEWLPPHSDLDIFFDMEGFPLEQDGLEYLWGCTHFDHSGQRAFTDFWAHTREQEKNAFEDFINWAYDRWQQDPGMHIYHYANYEIAACRRLMGRFGTCEDKVDQLLRNDVFVDLYKVVKSGIRLGEPSYSLKNVEHLYRGKRDTGVGTAGDAIVVYEQWRTLRDAGEEGDSWQTSDILNSIRDYNIDDCNSNQELTHWLRMQKERHKIAYRGKAEVAVPEITEEKTRRTALRDRLLDQADRERETDPVQATLTQTMAWFLEFHRRESKPVFWRMFDRLRSSHEELLDDPDCAACCQRTQRPAYKVTSRFRQLAYEYQFEPQEYRNVHEAFYLAGAESDRGKSVRLQLIKEASDPDNGRVVIQSKDEPPAIISLIPDEYVPAGVIEGAIQRSVSDFECGGLTGGKGAIVDFLTRSYPRIRGLATGSDIAPSHDPDKRLKQVISAVSHLDNSYLPIQGPPGAGKTHTARHVIAELLKTGARVGITSNSHKAINHLLLSTARYCHEKNIKANFYCTKETDPELTASGVCITKNAQLSKKIAPSCVIGTTAWGFAREDMEQELDYLFVDEAGQVSVANFIAVARSARNLVLTGDQMQLGQPSQASHPGDSGLSIMDYLMRDTPTIPADMGVFLGTTWRMHPAVNRFISEQVYEGRLEAHPDNSGRVIDVPEDYQGPLNKNAGIVFVPVAHEGNTQGSDEEVAVIRNLAKSLMGRTFHFNKDDQTGRPVSWDEMLFVAPYNLQVNKLKTALGPQARVGSVDKFQGQEAPIVFLSMCASDASESLRGLNFLFDRHRINVAVSRAQSLAIVVGNPSLGRTPVNRVEQLKLVNLFGALMQSA